MNFKRAVLREFLCPLPSNGEKYVALRADFDPSELSSYHQMVKKPGSADFTPEIIHAIVSQSSYEQVFHELKDEFKYVTPIGETYDVAPYVMGWRRVGYRDQKKLDLIMAQIADVEYFLTYVENWAETNEGHEAIIQDIVNESENTITEECIRELWDPAVSEDAEENFRYDKDRYVLGHASPHAPGYKDYKIKRLGDFFDAVKPLTEKQVSARIERYYALSKEEERQMLEENGAGTKLPRLLWALWPT